jgi:hypothetical protein
MAGKDKKDPSTTSFEYDAMIESWVRMETLLAGTAGMRGAGRAYLPQHPEESNPNYEERLNTNVLFNATELTLDHFVGRPFSDPVRLNTEVPDEIVDHSKNIDLQGNNITNFCREWFREGIAKGFCHVLIDMPSMDESEREGRTRADDLSDGRRPFWQLIKPENMIFAAADIISDPVSGERKERFTHVRLRENVIEQDGFSQVVRERIRVIEPGLFQVWEKRQIKRRKPEWVIIESGATGIDFVPIITYYSQREQFLVSKPPLEDLSFLNIRHWQSMSDQINILTVVRFPMLAVAGATDSGGETMAIGPRQLLATKDANGRFYYVEHKGNDMESGWKELENLEQSMEAYGSSFLKKDPGNVTATGRALDSAEAVTPLQDMTLRFMDAADNALAIHAHWLGKDTGGGVKITTDFGPEEVTGEDSAILLSLRKDRDISRLTVIKEAQRRGTISEDYDPNADFEQLVLEDEVLKPLQPQVPGTFDPSENDGAEPPQADSVTDDEPAIRPGDEE